MNLRKIYPLQEVGEPLVFLAPMADYTDAAMRRVCHRFGAALAYTEMVNAYSCARMDAKTWNLLETFPDEGPVVAHIYGTEPEIMAAAAQKIEASGRFVGIDVNAGCPVHKITCSGAGAALIKDPQRIHDLLAAMVKAVRLPVSIKTRLGPKPDVIAIFDILAAAESAGASALALHGRFTTEGHHGQVYLDLMAQVKAKARIPIIGNGQIMSPYAAWQMFRETGVDAVMVARGAIGSPWIFEDIRQALASGVKGDFPPAIQSRSQGRCLRDLGQIRSTLEEHAKGEMELIQRRLASAAPPSTKDAEALLALSFRAHLFRYLNGISGASYVRSRLNHLQNVKDIRDAVESCLAQEAALRAGR